jgi:hypothetical protein
LKASNTGCAHNLGERRAKTHPRRARQRERSSAPRGELMPEREPEELFEPVSYLMALCLRCWSTTRLWTLEF